MSISCWPSHPKAKATNPPPALSLPPPVAVAQEPAPDIKPPENGTPATLPPSKVPSTSPEVPGPPPAPKKSVRRPAPTPARSNPPATSQPAPAPAPATAEPHLRPVLSADQQRAYDATINDLIAKAEKNLTFAESKNPADPYRDIIRQARAFIAQCHEVRSRDASAAQSLAQRAEILSREVLNQIR